MKNRIALLFWLTFAVVRGYSQYPSLTIEGTTGKLYLIHNVVAKENWYSIGRLFNAPPHDIAGYNNLSFDKPLEIGTSLKIPLTAVNFDQKQVKSAGESLIPVYHIVQEKEWMFKISSIYNDVPVASLEKWNKLKRDEVKQGNSLIVGFLKVKTELSPLAMGVAANPATGGSILETQNKPVKPAEPTTPPLYKPILKNPPSASVASEGKPTGTATSGSTTYAGSGSSSATATPVSTTVERTNNYAITHSNGGFFSDEFRGSGKIVNGMGGTFRSTSGWSDGKYYALMNGMAIGTIIRVTGMNTKSIYAKVLGQLPDMKESSGLLIRISNAASAELGLGEGKFPIEVRY